MQHIPDNEQTLRDPKCPQARSKARKDHRSKEMVQLAQTAHLVLELDVLGGEDALRDGDQAVARKLPGIRRAVDGKVDEPHCRRRAGREQAREQQRGGGGRERERGLRAGAGAVVVRGGGG